MFRRTPRHPATFERLHPPYFPPLFNSPTLSSPPPQHHSRTAVTPPLSRHHVSPQQTPTIGNTHRIYAENTDRNLRRNSLMDTNGGFWRAGHTDADWLLCSVAALPLAHRILEAVMPLGSLGRALRLSVVIG